jgi:anti-sigma28 factor (negative regulator of flagellin synthesis)
MPLTGGKPLSGGIYRVNPLNRKGKGVGKTPLKREKSMPDSSPGDITKACSVKKVADLRTAVDNGTYRVEAKKVAEKIVRDAVREIRNRLR